MNNTPSILPPLFLIAGIFCFGLGFWASEQFSKKNMSYYKAVFPAESLEAEGYCWCGTSNSP